MFAQFTSATPNFVAKIEISSSSTTDNFIPLHLKPFEAKRDIKILTEFTSIAY